MDLSTKGKKVSNFKEWFDEADIPMQDKDGRWYDAETGFSYSDYQRNNSSTKATMPRQNVSEEAKEYRKTASQYGGKALTGTRKQKNWAEKIRNGILESLSEENCRIICMNKSAHSSKFWIENRDFKGEDFIKKVNAG